MTSGSKRGSHKHNIAHKCTQHTQTRRAIKIGALKMQFFCIFSISDEYLQKIKFSKGTVATCLRWGGWCRMGFVANFIRFSAIHSFENRLRFDKITESLKVGRFLRHSVCWFLYYVCLCNPASGYRSPLNVC